MHVAVQCVHARGSTVCTFTAVQCVIKFREYYKYMYVSPHTKHCLSKIIVLCVLCIHYFPLLNGFWSRHNYNVYFLFDMVAVLPEGDEVRARG